MRLILIAAFCAALPPGTVGCKPAKAPDRTAAEVTNADSIDSRQAAQGADLDLQPDWAPHPSRPVQFTDEELAFIRACANNEHMEFDPERGVLLGGEGNPKKGVVRWSVEYATVLMDAQEPAKLERALQILEVTLPTQYRNPGDTYHGNFPKFLEEPIVPGQRFDGNQADFIAMALLAILNRHEDRLPQPMKDRMREALLLAAEYIESRTIRATYTNAYFMGILNLLAIGERYDRPDFQEAGLEHLRKIHELTMDQGSYTEYQSPNYTTLVLDILHHLLAWVENPEARQLGLDLYRETWRQIASQYHPPSGQWAGPNLRNRGGEEILSDGKAWMIRRAVEDGKGIPPGTVEPSRKTVDLVRLPHRVPPDLRASFLELPGAKEVVQSYFTATPASRKYLPDDYEDQHDFVTDTIGTTWLHPRFAFGTANRGHFARDRRGIMAHWGTPERAGAMIIQFYKDGIPFCAPQHFAVQRQGRALYAVNIANNGGDTHWFLDRINGTFRAKDLRLSFEFMGLGKDATIRILDKESRIAEVASGDITFRIHVPVALFDGNEVDLKLGRPQSDRKTLDLVLHTGGGKDFDLRGFTDTAIGMALAVDADEEVTSFDALEASLQEHRLTLDWDGLHLSIPTLPDKDIALQRSFESSVDGQNRKLLEVRSPTSPEPNGINLSPNGASSQTSLKSVPFSPDPTHE